MNNAMTNGITVLIFSLLTVVKVYGQMNPLSLFENLQQYYKFLNLISWKKVYLFHTDYCTSRLYKKRMAIYEKIITLLILVIKVNDNTIFSKGQCSFRLQKRNLCEDS